jgi:hemerythrin-like domain-containing protein
MCDYCSCRDQPGISELAAEHSRVQQSMATARAAMAAGDEAAAWAALDELVALLGPHSVKEENGLYPALVRSGETELIDAMTGEHRHIDEGLLARGDDWQPRAAAALAELDRHIEHDEDDLVPAAVQVLSPAELARINQPS